MTVSLIVPVWLLLRWQLFPYVSSRPRFVSSNIPLALAFLRALMHRAETEPARREGREGACLGAQALEIHTCCHLACWCEPWEGVWFHGVLISQTLVTSVTAHWTTKCEHTIWLTAVLCQRPSFLLFGLTEHSRHLQSSRSSDRRALPARPQTQNRVSDSLWKDITPLTVFHWGTLVKWTSLKMTRGLFWWRKTDRHPVSGWVRVIVQFLSSDWSGVFVDGNELSEGMG